MTYQIFVLGDMIAQIPDKKKKKKNTYSQHQLFQTVTEVDTANIYGAFLQY